MRWVIGRSTHNLRPTQFGTYLISCSLLKETLWEVRIVIASKMPRLCLNIIKQQTENYWPNLRRSNRRKDTDKNLLERILYNGETCLEVRLFPIKGRGVVACKSFSKGEPVVEYVGELIDAEEALIREHGMKPECGSYLFFFTHRGKKLCIDATSEENKTLGRLVNHSRLHSNTKMKKFVGRGGEVHLVLYALRDIKPGEEIVYDYGERRGGIIAAYDWLKYT